MPLPDRPSLEYLKKLAKDRLQELRGADRSVRLAQAQLAVAREHGFPSWRALRAEVDRLDPRGAARPTGAAARTWQPPQTRWVMTPAILHEPLTW